MKKSVPLKDVHYSYFPRSRRDTVLYRAKWGETPGSVRRQKEQGENSESFYDYSSGNDFCWAGSETQMLGFVVGRLVIF